jgi:Amino acid permease
VVIGLGSMIGAGVFAAFAPAAEAAGAGLLIGLAVAAVVAYCNATASAQLDAQYSTSGGTYVYGRERLGEWWGFLAGWGFVVGQDGELRRDGTHPRRLHRPAVLAAPDRRSGGPRAGDRQLPRRDPDRAADPHHRGSSSCWRWASWSLPASAEDSPTWVD